MRFHEFKTEDNSDRGMNKYGLAARNKDGKFYSYRHGKLTGTFDNMADLQKHQHNLIKDESIKEGAEMIAYHKHPTQQNLWTFPDAYKDDEEVESPYMSNASMRQFLDALGYDSDFEDMSPVPAKEFIARTTQWLQKNIGKRSPEEPATRDGNMISGGKPEGYMNQMVKAHNEIARKVLAKYPEVTHFGFN
tara:strand:- start:785 stop:1357 length:573 start_codon:yes stop_codon:yes gene_type:complete